MCGKEYRQDVRQSLRHKHSPLNFHFIQQGNISFHFISFQSDFSRKTVRLRVLSWGREKSVKKTHGRIVRVGRSAKATETSAATIAKYRHRHGFLLNTQTFRPRTHIRTPVRGLAPLPQLLTVNLSDRPCCCVLACGTPGSFPVKKVTLPAGFYSTSVFLLPWVK